MTSDEAREYLFPLSSYDVAALTGLAPASVRAYLGQKTVPEAFELKIKDIDVGGLIKHSDHFRDKYLKRMNMWIENAPKAIKFKEENSL